MLHARFESFQIFGGLIFLVIGYRYVFEGADTIGVMRGAPNHLAGTIAMPFMIGPGTISASVITGCTAQFNADYSGDFFYFIFNLQLTDPDEIPA